MSKKSSSKISQKDIKNIQKYSKKSLGWFSSLSLVWKFVVTVSIIILIGVGISFYINNPQTVNDFLGIETQKNNPTEEILFDPSGKILYEVERVVDGDTVNLDDPNSQEPIKVRLIGLNTPETVDPRRGPQCFGKQASDKAKELLSGQKVYLEYDETQGTVDRYNRTLGYIIREDGYFYNYEMIKNGFANEYTYGKPYKYQSEFKEAQVFARENGLGLWDSNTCGGDFDAPVIQ